MSESAESALGLEFEDFRTFLDAFSANVSRSGMFVETAETRPPGSELDFDLRLEGGEELIHGRGEVVWVSDNDESPGMALRFLDLNSESERLIERMVEIRKRSGRELFDLDQGTAPAADEPEGDDVPVHSHGQPSNDEIRALEVELATVSAQRDELAERLQAQADDISRFSEQGKHAMAERTRLEGKIKRLAKQVEEQSAELARFSEQGKHALAERDRLEADRKALAESLEAAQGEVARLEGELGSQGEAEARLEEVQGTLAAAQALEKVLRGEVEEARLAAERSEEKAAESESKLRTEIQRLKKERLELRDNLERGQAELDETRRRYQASAEHALELEATTASMLSRLNTANERGEELEAEAKSLRVELDDLAGRNRSLESALEARDGTVGRLSKLWRRLSDEHARQRSGFEEAGALLAKLERPAAGAPEASETQREPEQRESEMAPEGEAEAETALLDSESDAKAESEREFQGEVEVEPGPEADAARESGSEAEAQLQADGARESGSEADAEPAADADSESEPDPESGEELAAAASEREAPGAPTEGAEEVVIELSEDEPAPATDKAEASGLWASLVKSLGKGKSEDAEGESGEDGEALAAEGG